MLSLTQTVVRRTPRTLLAGVRFMSDVKADKLIHQAPNRAEVWSDTQQRKAVAMTGPRFEQTNFELQPNPPSAQALIDAVPIQMVEARRVACNGGGGALGHPKVWLNLDKEEPQACGYCGVRYQQKHHH